MVKILTIGDRSLIFHNKRFHIVLNSQLWFWSDTWQEGEKQVNQDIKDGNILEFDSLEEFLDSLRKVDKWK